MKKTINIFYQHYLIKKLSNILTTTGLELRVFSDKIQGIFWLSENNKLNKFVYYIPKNLTFFYFFDKKKNNLGFNISYISSNYKEIISELKHFYNLVLGIMKPYTKTIEIYGTGFKFKIKENYPQKNKSIYIFAGFNNKIEKVVPNILELKEITPLILVLKAYDKRTLNSFSSNIKKIKPINKYKLRGIKYNTEQIRFKEYKKNK